MSQINRFYINKPSNFTELIIYKLYGYSLARIFAKHENKLNITIISNNSYTTDTELELIIKNISDKENKKIILNFDDKISENQVPNKYPLDNFKVGTCKYCFRFSFLRLVFKNIFMRLF